MNGNRTGNLVILSTSNYIDTYSHKIFIIVNICNSFSDYVVHADSVSTFKNRLDKYWINQDVVYGYKSDLTGTGGLQFECNVVMLFQMRA